MGCIIDALCGKDEDVSQLINNFIAKINDQHQKRNHSQLHSPTTIKFKLHNINEPEKYKMENHKYVPRIPQRWTNQYRIPSFP